MSEDDNDGTDYLRALKGSVGSQTSAAAAPARESSPARPPVSSVNSAPAGAFSGIDKRRAARYKCEGSAELSQENSNIRTWATFRDISVHGCYVEMTNSYPVGTVLNLKLEANGFQVKAEGCVRVSYPGLGMGIAFQHLSEEDRTRLKELVRTVARPVRVRGPALASSPELRRSTEAMPIVPDAASTLRALQQYFENREAMTRNEFLRILRGNREPDPAR